MTDTIRVLSALAEPTRLAAIGIPALSMRPASIGPVKNVLRRTNLDELRAVIHGARDRGEMSVRPAVMEFLRNGA